MNEVFMLVKKLYKDSGGGINKVVMNRSSSLANRGYNATILTVANFDVHETNKVLIKANKMNKKVKHINLYDYYSKINTKSNISRKQKKYYNLSSILYEQGFQVYNNESKNYTEYFQNGQYIKKKKWHKNGLLHYIDYFHESKKRVKREVFNLLGYIDKIIYYNLYNRYKSHIQHLTADGFCFLDIWYKGEDILDKYYLFNRNSKEVKQFLSPANFHSHWLEEITSNCKHKPYLICDKRMFAPVVRDIKANVHKIYAIHTNHNHRKNIEFSEINTILNHIRSLEQVVTLTEKQKRDILKEYGDYNNISVIPHSIPEKPKITEKKDKHLVTLVARLSSTKQIHQAIDSFKLVIDEVPNAKLEIFGAGKMRTSLEKQIKDLNLTNHVFLKGFTNDTNRIYQKSIVSLLTSKSEAFAMVLLESMINETPVISYDINYGPSDIITDGLDGFLIKEDINTLSEKIIYLLKNPNKAVEMGKIGRKNILKKYNDELVTKMWIDLFKNLKDNDK